MKRRYAYKSIHGESREEPRSRAEIAETISRENAGLKQLIDFMELYTDFYNLISTFTRKELRLLYLIFLLGGRARTKDLVNRDSLIILDASKQTVINILKKLLSKGYLKNKVDTETRPISSYWELTDVIIEKLDKVENILESLKYNIQDSHQFILNTSSTPPLAKIKPLTHIPTQFFIHRLTSLPKYDNYGSTYVDPVAYTLIIDLFKVKSACELLRGLKFKNKS